MGVGQYFILWALYILWKCNAACVLCNCIVEYAPAIGMYTLDMEEMFSRDEVYKLSWHGDQRADCTKMDAEEIFIPESQYYHVASIIQGNIYARSMYAG